MCKFIKNCLICLLSLIIGIPLIILLSAFATSLLVFLLLVCIVMVVTLGLLTILLSPLFITIAAFTN